MPPPEAVAGAWKGPDGKSIKVAPLTDEDKLNLVRWIDLGCPIDLDHGANKADPRAPGWMLDEGRPTLTLTYPAPGLSREPLTRILVGMHDYYTGLDMSTFHVVADFEVNGVAGGDNLAPQFKPTAQGVWELKLAKPITTLPKARLMVSIKDRQGNITRMDRTFSVTAGGGAPSPPAK
jgi:hypothetical protein